MSYIDKVFKVVKKIPRGRLMTYGQVAKIVVVDPRMVGWALHSNKDKNVPCHRVVNKDGRLAPNFAFDGWREQKKMLGEEGVKFIDEIHADLNRQVK